MGVPFVCLSFPFEPEFCPHVETHLHVLKRKCALHLPMIRDKDAFPMGRHASRFKKKKTTTMKLLPVS